MPKLRRLNGKQVIAILESLGFTIIRIKGSHHQMQRDVAGKHQTITVPLHGTKALSPKTLHSIYRQVAKYVPDDVLKSLFYGD